MLSFLVVRIFTFFFFCLYRPVVFCAFFIQFLSLCLSTVFIPPLITLYITQCPSWEPAQQPERAFRRERVHFQNFISIILQNLRAQTCRKESWFNFLWWKCLFLKIYFSSAQRWKIILKSTWLNNVFTMSVERRESGYVWNHTSPQIRVWSVLQKVLATFSPCQSSNTK